MPQELVSMRKLREVLRLKLVNTLSNRSIARAVQISAGTVSNYTRAAKSAGLSFEQVDRLSDSELVSLLKPHCNQLRATSNQSKLPPDFDRMHRELKKKGVTLQLLHEEYQLRYSSETTYSYSVYCRRYRDWLKQQKPSLRQNHKAGEKVFVDYAGPTIAITDPKTGEVKEAKLFIAAFAVSHYIYAEATLTRSIPDWIGSHVRMLNYFGGVPELIIPDNEKAGVKDACYYDPDLNPNYAAFAAHYGTTILPTRPGKPKDKGKVENAVLIVERWIMARLRHHKFFSLSELNKAIQTLLESLNNRTFKRKPGSRSSEFQALDKPALSPLPATRYQVCEFKKARVGSDYHVDIDGHYYSVPYHLIQQPVQCQLTQHTVMIYHQHQRVAIHPRSTVKGKATTNDEHMPAAHRHHQQWTPEVFEAWGIDMGDAVAKVAKQVIATQPHPECCYRIHLGLKSLAKRYDREELNKACNYALLTISQPTYRSIKSILSTKLYQQTSVLTSTTSVIEPPDSQHSNVRGSDYYSQSTTKE